MEAADDIVRSRQTWFWRRVTLQAVLFVQAIVLAATILITSHRSGDWPTAAVQLGILTSQAWLVTMYFAMVDNASKVSAVIEDIGKAVGAAKTVTTTTTATTASPVAVTATTTTSDERPNEPRPYQ